MYHHTSSYLNWLAASVELARHCDWSSVGVSLFMSSSRITGGAACRAKKELCACGQAGLLLLLLEVHHVNHILRLQKVVKEILESQVADWPFKVLLVMMNNELKGLMLLLMFSCLAKQKGSNWHGLSHPTYTLVLGTLRVPFRFGANLSRSHIEPTVVRPKVSNAEWSWRERSQAQSLHH